MRRLLAPVLLLPMVLSACGDATPGSDPERFGTVRGVVLLEPTCPVESSTSPCPDQPLAGLAVEARSSQGRVVQNAVTDGRGTFALVDLPVGTYTIHVITGDQARTSAPVSVSVAAGETVEVIVPVDSGIR